MSNLIQLTLGKTREYVRCFGKVDAEENVNRTDSVYFFRYVYFQRFRRKAENFGRNKNLKPRRRFFRIYADPKNRNIFPVLHAGFGD